MDEGGVWYGPDPNRPHQKYYQSCCAIKNAIADGSFKDFTDMDILPDYQHAIRNDTYKLVQLENPDCNKQPDSRGAYPDVKTNAFYEIDEAQPTPMLDNKKDALCGDRDRSRIKCPIGLTTQDEITSYYSLLFDMTQLLKSEPACPGDGNEDKVVNNKDIQSWLTFSELAHGGSSWSDFNLDGKTNLIDLAIILRHFGTNCLTKK